MVDLKTLIERLGALRGAGVKSVGFDVDGEVSHVEFFPHIAPLDLDTLVPPAPEEAATTEPVPAAIARILQKGSVS